MEKIDLIGGSGFIGTRFCDSLPSNILENLLILDKTVSVDYPDITKRVDVRSLQYLREAIRADSTIINLAAEHRDDVSPKSLYYDVNVEGARNICLVAREKNVKKIIFTSSVAVYGFAKIDTNESGKINPFNDYGKTKFEAEQIFKAWQAEDQANRTLVIIRPTVVFGERNRGNVYNLIKQVASGKFLMVGKGLNRKSIAYVGNLVEFIKFSLTLGVGSHLFNYVDKPNYSMRELVSLIGKSLNRPVSQDFKLPYYLGVLVGIFFDAIACITQRKFSISSIRVKKFCKDSVYDTAVEKTDFTQPTELIDAINKTVRYEFMEESKDEHVFFSE
jgi:nucleoside-diphosphate-sugar epimerase